MTSDPVTRLDLRFRPEDPYCKPAYGDRSATTNLLLKVHIRKRRKRPPGEAALTQDQHKAGSSGQGQPQPGSSVQSQPQAGSSGQGRPQAGSSGQGQNKTQSMGQSGWVAGDNNSQDDMEYQFKAEVLGIIDTEFNFQSKLLYNSLYKEL